MNKLLKLGEIVTGGLLFAKQDGKIEYSEVLDIINQCAKEIGLGIRLAEVNKDDAEINKLISEVETIRKQATVCGEKVAAGYTEMQKLEHMGEVKKDELNKAIEMAAIKSNPQDGSQSQMSQIIQVHTVDEAQNTEAEEIYMKSVISEGQDLVDNLDPPTEAKARDDVLQS